VIGGGFLIGAMSALLRFALDVFEHGPADLGRDASVVGAGDCGELGANLGLDVRVHLDTATSGVLFHDEKLSALVT
jgi:hypothetical protein